MAGSGKAHLRDGSEAILRVEDLTVVFRSRHAAVQAVSGVSFDVLPGETLGLVGESGCGKSTTAKAIVQMPAPSSGSVRFNGHELTALKGEELRRIRPDIQMIYQDPISSLNPRMSVGRIVGEPLEIWGRGTGGSGRRRRNVPNPVVDEILTAVGIDPDSARDKRPREFSGGQCQRICIARAMVLEPKLVICDEPVSALDVSIQAQVLNLLEDMKQRYGLTLVFIAHDLAVVKNISDRVIVMYLGKLCEVGGPDQLYEAPAHPYTAALLSAIPIADPDSTRKPQLLTGDLPSPADPPSGCRFRTRCPRAEERCGVDEPQLRALVSDPSRHVACHFPLLDAVDPVAPTMPTGMTVP